MWLDRREAWSAQAEDAREQAEIDYARIVHSGSFRRLQGKTQILNLGDSDFYRTRLTHSLEVAQIAGGIARQFEKNYESHPAYKFIPNLSLIQAIGFTHDLGHPPFGHGGEVALNYCMRDHGGFEGNGQTLRILSKLEKFSDKAGANLTRRTLLGVLKYPIPFHRAFNPALAPRLDESATIINILDRRKSKPPKCYMDSEEDVVDWILRPLGDDDRTQFCAAHIETGKHKKSLHKSFDSSIMDLADDIGFGVHDLEDALALKLITEEEFRHHVPEDQCGSFLTKLKERYPSETGNDVYEGFVKALFGEGQRRKRFISRMVHHLITHCQIETLEQFQEPLVRFRAVLAPAPLMFLKALQAAVRETVILSPSVQHLEFKGQQMVISVFEALSSDPKAFLPSEVMRNFLSGENPSRVVCDHVAGMTDSFLLKTYERLFSPRMGSVFDRL